MGEGSWSWRGLKALENGMHPEDGSRKLFPAALLGPAFLAHWQGKHLQPPHAAARDFGGLQVLVLPHAAARDFDQNSRP